MGRLLKKRRSQKTCLNGMRFFTNAPFCLPGFKKTGLLIAGIYPGLKFEIYLRNRAKGNIM